MIPRVCATCRHGTFATPNEALGKCRLRKILDEERDSDTKEVKSTRVLSSSTLADESCDQWEVRLIDALPNV